MSNTSVRTRRRHGRTLSAFALTIVGLILAAFPVIDASSFDGRSLAGLALVVVGAIIYTRTSRKDIR